MVLYTLHHLFDFLVLSFVGLPKGGLQPSCDLLRRGGIGVLTGEVLDDQVPAGQSPTRAPSGSSPPGGTPSGR